MNRWEIEKDLLDSSLLPPTRHVILTLLVLVDSKTAVIPERFTPSLTTLAAATGLARSTLAKHLNDAETAGWLVRTRPPIELARSQKACTQYRITSPGDGLDKPGTSPGDGPELVRETDRSSPGAGHRSDLEPSTHQGGRSARSIVAAAGAAEDEIDEVIRKIQQKHNPHSLGGFLVKLASNGDLVKFIAEVRDQRRRVELRLANERRRSAAECEHGEPGGAELHPESGEPWCAMCRAGVAS